MNLVPKADCQRDENDAELTGAGATRDHAGRKAQTDHWGSYLFSA